MTEIDYKRAWVMKDSLNFTRYFFYSQKEGMKFIVGNHHKLICAKLDEVLKGKCKRLIINMPPRYGKTEIAVKRFIEIGLAINPMSNFLHLSYSAELATENSVSIKETIISKEYQELFDVRIKYGKDTKRKWETTAGGGLYATSTLGSITGFGAGMVEDPNNPDKFCGAIIIDDPIKPQDAMSDIIRDSVNQRFETTIRSRVNSRNTPIIIIMQRLHQKDLCGYLLAKEPGVWDVLSLPALSYDEEGKPKALWEFKHTVNELMALRDANEYVFDTQYEQNPTPLGGLMYNRQFKTYSAIPATKTKIRKNYTDTADKGSDYLCSIDYVETEIGNFILDILYTQKPMDYTEPMTGAMWARDEIDIANVEGNNGGEGFARNAEKETRAVGNKRTRVNTFHQSANKQTRIFSRSNEVMNLTYFPEGWEEKYPAFHDHVVGFRKDGTNEHDDAEDALTGTVEMRGRDIVGISFYEGEPEGTKVLFAFPSLDSKFIVLDATIEGEIVCITDVLYKDEYTDSVFVEKALSMSDDTEILMECDRNFVLGAKTLRNQNRQVRLLKRNGNPALRIQAQSEYVRDYVRFNPDYGKSSDYTSFIDAIQDYNGDSNFGALDAVSALASYVRKKHNRD